MRVRDPERRRLVAWRVGEQAWLDTAPAGNPRRHHRQLEWVGDDIALADRGVQRLADAPRLAVALFLPRLVGDDARRLARHRQVVLLAKPQPPRHRRDLLNACCTPERVEIHVATLGDAFQHVDAAVSSPRPAVPGIVAEPVAAVAAGGLLGGRPALQRRQRGDHLEGRAGGVQALRALVDERVMVAGLELVPQVGGNAGRKDVGVVGGHRAHAQHVAGLAVHDDDARRIVADAARGIGLQRLVDGQADSGAGRVAAGIEIADHPAAGVDLDPARARDAAQARVLRALDTVLAELEAGEDQQRVMLALVLLWRRCADIAEQVAECLASRIDAAEARDRDQAGQIGQADVERREVAPREAVRQFDRHVLRLARDLGVDARQFLGRQRQHRRYRAQRRVEVGNLLRDQLDAVVGGIGGQRLPDPVDDPAPARRDQAQRDAVVLRRQPVFLALEHGEIGHARRQRAADSRHAAADQQGAAGEDRINGRFAGHLSHIRWSRAHSSTTSG